MDVLQSMTTEPPWLFRGAAQVRRRGGGAGRAPAQLRQSEPWPARRGTGDRHGLVRRGRRADGDGGDLRDARGELCGSGCQVDWLHSGALAAVPDQVAVLIVAPSTRTRLDPPGDTRRGATSTATTSTSPGPCPRTRATTNWPTPISIPNCGPAFEAAEGRGSAPTARRTAPTPPPSRARAASSASGRALLRRQRPDLVAPHDRGHRRRRSP